MSESREKDQVISTRSMVLVIILGGIAVYLVCVMPLRIIFRNPQNGIFRTLMPFGNILSGPAVGSFLMYGLAAAAWTIIGVNYFNTNPRFADCCDRDTYIFLSVIGSITTILSVIIAWWDVRNSMEESD